MKYQDIMRGVLCLVGMSVAICLTGCSISFCGYPLGGRDELVFSCREEYSEDERKDAKGEESERTAAAGQTGDSEYEDRPEGILSDGAAPEESASSDEGAAGGKVNINTAGMEELMTLKGVGETRAKAIIEYRTQNGGFTKAEDIMQIPGIKEGIYTKIQDQIIVQ